MLPRRYCTYTTSGSAASGNRRISNAPSLAGWNVDVGEHERTDVSLRLQAAVDRFRLIRADLRDFALDPHVDLEPGGDRPGVLMPPAAPTRLAAQRHEHFSPGASDAVALQHPCGVSQPGRALGAFYPGDRDPHRHPRGSGGSGRHLGTLS